MSACKECLRHTHRVTYQEGAVVAAARKAIRYGRPSDHEALAKEKSRLAVDKQSLTNHEAECGVAA